MQANAEAHKTVEWLVEMPRFLIPVIGVQGAAVREVVFAVNLGKRFVEVVGIKHIYRLRVALYKQKNVQEEKLFASCTFQLATCLDAIQRLSYTVE